MRCLHRIKRYYFRKLIISFRRYLFWTDWGTFKIERATLAGDERKVIVPLVDHGAFISNGLTIDYESNRLFWIDDYADQIGTCDFNGGYLTFVAKLSNQVKDVRPYDLALYDRTIFWSETNDETIHRYDLKRHLNLPNIYGPVGYVLGLTVDHHTRQPRGISLFIYFTVIFYYN